MLGETSPTRLVHTQSDVPMKTRMRPLVGTTDVTVLHGVPMDVIEMCLEILFVFQRVLPISRLPNPATPLSLATCRHNVIAAANLRRYVFNSPENFRDPRGTEPSLSRIDVCFGPCSPSPTPVQLPPRGESLHESSVFDYIKDLLRSGTKQFCEEAKDVGKDIRDSRLYQELKRLLELRYIPTAMKESADGIWWIGEKVQAAIKSVFG